MPLLHVCSEVRIAFFGKASPGWATPGIGMYTHTHEFGHAQRVAKRDQRWYLSKGRAANYLTAFSWASHITKKVNIMVSLTLYLIPFRFDALATFSLRRTLRLECVLSGPGSGTRGLLAQVVRAVVCISFLVAIYLCTRPGE